MGLTIIAVIVAACVAAALGIGFVIGVLAFFAAIQETVDENR